MPKPVLKIKKNDLFFHYIHGLCRVTMISKPYDSQDEKTYTLLPVEKNPNNTTKFHIQESGFPDSCFIKLVSVEEAQSILVFLKNGKEKKNEITQLWALAKFIYEAAESKDHVKTGPKRLELDRALRALVAQLAFILNLSVKETASRIQENLSAKLDINPYISHFLSGAS